MGIFYPKTCYKDVKAEDRTGQRIVGVSSREAKALRVQSLLRDQNAGWGSGEGNDQKNADRVAKETYEMLSSLLKNTKA